MKRILIISGIVLAISAFIYFTYIYMSKRKMVKEIVELEQKIGIASGFPKSDAQLKLASDNYMKKSYKELKTIYDLTVETNKKAEAVLAEQLRIKQLRLARAAGVA